MKEGEKKGKEGTDVQGSSKVVQDDPRAVSTPSVQSTMQQGGWKGEEREERRRGKAVSSCSSSAL